jgi:hypothetical protein
MSSRFNPLPGRLYLNRKYRNMRPVACLLLVHAHMHADEHELDGVVDLSDFNALAGFAHIALAQVPGAVDQMLRSGWLLKREDGSYELCGFMGTSHEVREQQRAANRVRQQRNRETGQPGYQMSHRDNPRDSGRDSGRDSHRDSRAGASPSPSPSPSPHPLTPLSALTGDFADEYESFLAALNSATGRNFRGDAVSRGLYADRRRDGRSAADLEAAARGVVLSPHHMGRNDLQVPLNDPKHVLKSEMLDGLIGLGTGEIGASRVETADERFDREWGEMAARRRPELQA